MEQPLVQQTKAKQAFHQNQAHQSRFAACSAVIICLVWAYFFWSRLKDTTQVECADPVWFWSHYAQDYYISAAIIIFICSLCLPFVSKKATGGLKSFLNALTTIPVLLTLLGGLALSIGIIVSFSSRNQCSNLATIIAVHFYFSIVSLSLAACCTCCTCLFCSTAFAALKVASSLPDEAQNSSAQPARNSGDRNL